MACHGVFGAGLPNCTEAKRGAILGHVCHGLRESAASQGMGLVVAARLTSFKIHPIPHFAGVVISGRSTTVGPASTSAVVPFGLAA